MDEYIANNKHNSITSSYYLLLKKRSRETGQDHFWEQAIIEKMISKFYPPKLPSFDPFLMMSETEIDVLMNGSKSRCNLDLIDPLANELSVI
jgi:hypothetical protein